MPDMTAMGWQIVHESNYKDLFWIRCSPKLRLDLSERINSSILSVYFRCWGIIWMSAKTN